MLPSSSSLFTSPFFENEERRKEGKEENEEEGFTTQKEKKEKKEKKEEKDELQVLLDTDSSALTAHAPYSRFYALIYDALIESPLRIDFEVSQVLSSVRGPNTRLMDLGCATGRHVQVFRDRGLPAFGIDASPAMIEQAERLFHPNPGNKATGKDEGKQRENAVFQVGDIRVLAALPVQDATHLTAFYFTVYYIQDKRQFFRNCWQWLVPGGHFFLHLVDRDRFDPILPSGNPLLIVSPQKYAKERILDTKVTFHGFQYKAHFVIPQDDDSAIGLFRETFTFRSPLPKTKSFTQEHILYMEPHEEIVSMAVAAGFAVKQTVNMVECAYENQYLVHLVKTS